jgi:hypothetical protein
LRGQCVVVEVWFNSYTPRSSPFRLLKRLLGFRPGEETKSQVSRGGGGGGLPRPRGAGVGPHPRFTEGQSRTRPSLGGSEGAAGGSSGHRYCGTSRSPVGGSASTSDTEPHGYTKLGKRLFGHRSTFKTFCSAEGPRRDRLRWAAIGTTRRPPASAMARRAPARGLRARHEPGRADRGYPTRLDRGHLAAKPLQTVKRTGRPGRKQSESYGCGCGTAS